jgi:hypothetical protein
MDVHTLSTNSAGARGGQAVRPHRALRLYGAPQGYIYGGAKGSSAPLPEIQELFIKSAYLMREDR